MRVRHFGNTANNAYYNSVLLEQFGGIESDLPISMFGLSHAISAPAWEAVDFEVPSVEWVPRPDWSLIPGAVAVNSHYTDLVPLVAPEAGDAPASTPGLRARATKLASAALQPLHGKRVALPIWDVAYRTLLAGRSVQAQSADQLDVLYGADSLVGIKMPETGARYVCLEHGTVRWIADGDREMAAFRSAYRTQVQRAGHLWVTNLDPRTLEIAEDVAPGRWSVVPHPYVPDARVPFATAEPVRRALLERARASSLVLLPSSQNWGKHHDKGSMKALNAFVELRRAGVDVGLVAVEWGLQLAESKAFLDSAGVAANVVWVAPMAKLGLQRMMANVDVVWDQFGLAAFGGLAMRAVEQGIPLISRGLAPIGEQLIGGPVPWLHAVDTSDIVRQTTAVLDDMARDGRVRVITETRNRYRTWMLERHSPGLTADLQLEVYDRMIDGTLEPGSIAPGRWGELLNEQLGQKD
jgi:hypothetical protein